MNSMDARSSFACKKAASAPLSLDDSLKPGGKGDPLRAPSVFYLTTGLQKELREVGLTGASTVREVEKLVIRPSGEHSICPRDGNRGCALVDTLEGDDNAGKATVMLSYTWGYTIGDIVASLKCYCNRHGLDPKRTYVWICAFCINQHRVQEALRRNELIPFEQFAEEFGGRVKSIRHILALMGPWHSPQYIKRAWCLYELAVGMDVDGCKVEILMPPSESVEFTKALLSSPNSLEELWSVLTRVCVARAEASVPADKENILRCIEAGPGLVQLNEKLRSKLKAWFADAAEAEAYDLLKNYQQERCSSPTFGVIQVSTMLSEMGRPESALELLHTALTYVRPKHARDHTATVLTALGSMLARLGDMQAASVIFSEAHELLDVQAVECPSPGSTRCRPAREAEIDLHCGMGAFHVMQGRPSQALEHFSKAYLIVQSLGCLETRRGLGLLLDIALTQADLKDTDAAGKTYSEVEKLHKKLGLPSLTTATGAVLHGKYPVASAERFEQRRRVYTKVGIMASARGAYISTLQGFALVQVGRMSEALASCEEALRLHGAAGTLKTPFGADSLDTLANIQKQLDNDTGAESRLREAQSIRRDCELSIDASILQQEFCVALCAPQADEGGMKRLEDALRSRSHEHIEERDFVNELLLGFAVARKYAKGWSFTRTTNEDEETVYADDESVESD
eukprot:TRINITY_DN16968_c0_g1_i1.p1 TRINITY_DN16968_c0_g1~~TRINITY_DN16968_c0_g1_i1.p1  ORF type:complete len:685 (+),score=145.62 TRINITY_DN16968_c0_g1_i1:69-2123(+)